MQKTIIVSDRTNLFNEDLDNNINSFSFDNEQQQNPKKHRKKTLNRDHCKRRMFKEKISNFDEKSERPDFPQKRTDNVSRSDKCVKSKRINKKKRSVPVERQSKHVDIEFFQMNRIQQGLYSIAEQSSIDIAISGVKMKYKAKKILINTLFDNSDISCDDSLDSTLVGCHTFGVNHLKTADNMQLSQSPDFHSKFDSLFSK